MYKPVLLLTIPCLGQVQTLVRTDSHKITTLLRTERPKAIPSPAASPRTPYWPSKGVPPEYEPGGTTQ